MLGYPRILSALWFGIASFVATGLMFFFAALNRGPEAIFLYIVLPILASALSGAMFAKTFIREDSRHWCYGLLFGPSVAIVAFALFSLIFIPGTMLIGESGSYSWSLSIVVFVIGLIATCPITIPMGCIAGGSLALYSAKKMKKNEGK